MALNMAQLGLRHALARARGKQIEVARCQARARQQLETVQAELADLATAAVSAAQEVTQLTEALALVFADPASTVVPRQTFPKRRLSSWGSLSRTILGILRTVGGGPLAATELANQVQKALGAELNTAAEETRFRRHIGRTLKNMYHAGYLQRLHDPTKPREGIWELKASFE